MSVIFSTKQVTRVRDLLALLSGSLRAARFYPASHPAFTSLVNDLYKLIDEFHSEGVDVPLTFFEGELLLGEQVLTGESIAFDQLIRDMTALGADSVTFVRDLTPDELARAISVLSADPGNLPAGGIPELLASANLPHVAIGTVSIAGKGTAIEPGEEHKIAEETYTSAIEMLRELERVVGLAQPANIKRVRGVVQGLIEGVVSNKDAMLELAGLKSYDEYTFFHSVNVAILSLAIGAAITGDRRFLSSLGVGALMHDLGKMDIHVDVLNKPGALSAEEWAIMRCHPLYGAEEVARLAGVDKSAVVVILEHHMRYDLSGYPQSATPAAGQHLASRIVAVADAYDAMTSRRSYSAARLQDEAMSVLVKNMGNGFDPALVRIFVKLMGAYPPRSVVRLSTGETGIVLKANADDLVRPSVRIFADSNGDLLTEPFDVDLSALPDGDSRAISGCLDPAGMNVDIDEYLE